MLAIKWVRKQHMDMMLYAFCMGVSSLKSVDNRMVEPIDLCGDPSLLLALILPDWPDLFEMIAILVLRRTLSRRKDSATRSRSRRKGLSHRNRD